MQRTDEIVSFTFAEAQFLTHSPGFESHNSVMSGFNQSTPWLMPESATIHQAHLSPYPIPQPKRYSDSQAPAKTNHEDQKASAPQASAVQWASYGFYTPPEIATSILSEAAHALVETNRNHERYALSGGRAPVYPSVSHSEHKAETLRPYLYTDVYAVERMIDIVVDEKVVSYSTTFHKVFSKGEIEAVLPVYWC